MTSNKDFKIIADEIMSDIRVTEELKEKVLMRSMKKKKISINRYIAIAASFILIIGTINLFGMFSMQLLKEKEGNPDVNLLVDSDNNGETLPAQTDNSFIGQKKRWILKTLLEAKRSFGDSFLSPSYIPEGFQLTKISATGTKKEIATKVVLSFNSDSQSFLVIEEKSNLQYGFINYKVIEINGTVGHLKPNTLSEDTNNNLDTELHWLKNGIHYSVVGLISDDEAIKVAESMDK